MTGVLRSTTRATYTALIALLVLFAGRARADTPLSIAVSGERFINGSGQTVQLVGVDRMSTEYACSYGYGYANGQLDSSDAVAIAAWHANAVRIPLNEDCWLGINGDPAGHLTEHGYRQAIQSYVEDLNADGIYAILDLHWTNPEDIGEDGQHAMPDENSLSFWESVASTFKSDPAVLFDAFNEPFSPAANGNSTDEVSWSCWKSGGCEVPDANDTKTPVIGQNYKAVGLQQIVTAIRSTGADEPILLGGLSYANDLSQWLTYEPSDPQHQLAASFHNYLGESCDSETCWNSTIATLAKHVPVVTGEFDEEDCPQGGGENPGDFDNRYMNWADRHGVSYLAWGWVPLEKTEPCSSLFLLTGSGEPTESNGVALHDHLVALAEEHQQSEGKGSETSEVGGSEAEGKGSETSETGGSETEGKGSKAGGSEAEGKGSETSETGGSEAEGKGSETSETGGSETEGKGSEAEGKGSETSEVGGSEAEGKGSETSEAGGSEVGGKSSETSEAGGSEAEGKDSKTSETGGSEAEGKGSETSETGGSETEGKGSEVGGSEVGGKGSETSETGGSKSEGKDPETSETGGSKSEGKGSEISTSGSEMPQSGFQLPPLDTQGSDLTPILAAGIDFPTPPAPLLSGAKANFSALRTALNSTPALTRSTLLSQKGWNFHFHAPEPGRVDVQLMALSAHGRVVVLASGAESFADAISGQVRTVLTAMGGRLLRANGALRLILRLTFTDLGESSVQQQRSIAISPKRKRRN